MTATSGADRKPCGCEGYREHHHGCTKFTAADRPTLREQIADVLATHVIVSLSGVVVRCSCGWDSTSRIIDGLARVSENRAHLAAALLPVVERAKAEAAAEALERAADEVDTWSGPYISTPAYRFREQATALRSQGGGR